MTVVFNVLILLFFFFLMEGVAWFTHKYIMHGFMWNWHKSHHEPRKGLFEKNDLFALVFGSISAMFIVWGSFSMSWMFFAGLGIALYGVAYFLVHDVFVHQRLKLFSNTSKVYFKAMRFAHKVHHKTRTKEGAEAFGFLFVSSKYIKKFKKSQQPSK
jgi:beta-carotene 3-hydroxylase